MFSEVKTASVSASAYLKEPTICLEHAFRLVDIKRVSLLLILLPVLFFNLQIIVDDFRDDQHAIRQVWALIAIDLNELPEEAAAEDEEVEVVESDTARQPSLSEKATKLAIEEEKTGGDICDQEKTAMRQQQQIADQQALPLPTTWWDRFKCNASGALKTSQCALNQLPKYFDFETFKRRFKRTYSPSEALFRKSIFLKRCFQVFKSRLAYRLGITNYIQGVNKFTDRSDSEIKRMFMAGPPIEFRPAKQSKEEYLKEMKQIEEERVELEQAGLFVEFESQSSLFSTNDLNHFDANELKFVNFDFLLANNNGANVKEAKQQSDGSHISSKQREKKEEGEGEGEEQSATTIIHECKLKKKIQHLFANTEDEELLKAIQDEIYDFKIETFSQTAASSFNCETKPLPKLFKYTTIVDSYDQENDNDDGDLNDRSYAERHSNDENNNNNKRKRVFNLDLNKLEEEQQNDGVDTFNVQGKQKQFKFKVGSENETTANTINRHYQEPKLRDECDSLDWSKHDCFHQIYDQGTKCGRCYVMASTSLAEFYKCNENESKLERRKFSKDYVLNCGQKYSPTTILGCLGGSILDTLKFISLAGVYNIRNWKLKLESELKRVKSASTSNINNIVASNNDLHLKCPIDQYESPFSEWGQIKLNIKPLVVHTNNWFKMLKGGPIVVSVQMPSVESYESGVHDGIGCETSGNWHSMLLVGYGMNERRISYWKFRNSWGANWGEKGHFKLAMSVSGKCLAGGVRAIYQNKLQV